MGAANIYDASNAGLCTADSKVCSTTGTVDAIVYACVESSACTVTYDWDDLTTAAGETEVVCYAETPAPDALADDADDADDDDDADDADDDDADDDDDDEDEDEDEET